MTRRMIGLGVVFLLVGGAFAWRARVSASKPRNTHSVFGYPHGVWPFRVQPFGDRFVEVRAGTQGSLRLFFMGGANKDYTPLDVSTLEGEVISASGDASPVTLRAVPIKGVSGKGSWLYEGQAPMERVQTNKWGLYGLRITVPYSGVNHSVVWRPEQTSAWIDTRHSASGGDVVMPSALSSEVERKLFLTPGGKYTGADIAANGNAVASVRYRGIMAAHSLKPKKGSLICPITNTLANPQFTWIIDGKTYRFCCPPCIAEFVRQAKEKPKSLQSPEDYKAT